MVLTKKFSLSGLSVPYLKKHFSFLIVVVLVKAFSNILQYAKFQSFLPCRPNHGGPSDGIKSSKFLSYDCSRYNS